MTSYCPEGAQGVSRLWLLVLAFVAGTLMPPASFASASRSRVLGRYVVLLVVLFVVGCGPARPSSTSTSGLSIFVPAWSPDGRSIAWEEPVAGGNEIWIGNADGAHARRVSAPIDALGELRWLTDDELVYWANFRIFRLRLPSKGTSLVSSVIGGEFSLDAHGTRIASGVPGCPLCAGPVEIISLADGFAWAPDSRQLLVVAPFRRVSKSAKYRVGRCTQRAADIDRGGTQRGRRSGRAWGWRWPSSHPCPRV